MKQKGERHYKSRGFELSIRQFDRVIGQRVSKGSVIEEKLLLTRWLLTRTISGSGSMGGERSNAKLPRGQGKFQKGLLLRFPLGVFGSLALKARCYCSLH